MCLFLPLAVGRPACWGSITQQSSFTSEWLRPQFQLYLWTSSFRWLDLIKWGACSVPRSLGGRNAISSKITHSNRTQVTRVRVASEKRASKYWLVRHVYEVIKPVCFLLQRSCVVSAFARESLLAHNISKTQFSKCTFKDAVSAAWRRGDFPARTWKDTPPWEPASVAVLMEISPSSWIFMA